MSLPLPSFFQLRTIPQYLRYHAEQTPNKTAVVAWSGIKKDKMRLSYSELNRLTDQLANAYQEAEIQKGERIAIFMDNEQGMECILSFYAAHKIGGINVPINARFSEPELQYILEHCEASTIITSVNLLSKVQGVAGECPSLRRIIVAGDAPLEVPLSNTAIRMYSFQTLMENGNSSPPTARVEETDDADWLYTSGTTARPKGVIHTHASAVATGYSVGGALGLSETDVYQSAFPFFTSSGCHFNLLSVLVYGATMVLDRKFDVEETLSTMESEKTTVYVGVPAVYTFMLESGNIPNYELSSLRLLDYGGAPMPKQVILDLFKAFPGIELRQTYGLTEAGPTGTYLPGEYALDKLGSVGKCGMPLVEVKIVDEKEQEVGPNVIGEICYRSPANMRGYFKNEEATKETLRDGWVHSGDLVYRDEDGFIYHVDRKKDLIIRGGFNISSLEVENCLYQHPAVLEVAVVAKPHKNLGEDIKAFIVFREGKSVTNEEIIAFCRERLADFKVPRDFEIIDALPRNPMGKVLKTELRKKV
ncbi:class I adenylate-forming enzyme family protein [Aneurinibacillus danicus]|jgi:acyl-CoA synthetase (AMP-forming)/AMP-acid ligase II|uniref:Long-chain-fatty-acid--CoA ligase n=1 Tax=Aneurinibacillus danicus TaxID=267746 RepID=A0A511VC64_9BACL|nr:long-chain-fatty-acid--CoA ligase [Aneurinibacillus danicus]GEN36505.1 long-chain-fatty-acid--CoA ligase [Aneurinibacillus danicus]